MRATGTLPLPKPRNSGTVSGNEDVAPPGDGAFLGNGDVAPPIAASRRFHSSLSGESHT